MTGSNLPPVGKNQTDSDLFVNIALTVIPAMLIVTLFRQFGIVWLIPTAI
jgi:hypothetical protein